MEQSELFLCPISRQNISDLTDEQIRSLNSEIERGERIHADGSPVAHGLARVLATPDLRYCYRADEGIFCLLPNLAIVRQADATLAERDAAKTIVQTFYDEFGWVKDEGGKFNDTTAFMVSSHVADSYIDTCNARVGAELRRGKYLLDAASGAIPLASYLPYSRDYDQRVCVDFSIRALHEARAKLPNGRGVFVLGDITCLPIRDGVIDDAISLHTLYHVPRDLQTQAVDELVRTLKPKGKLVVVYTWGASPIMRIIRRVVRPVAKPDGSQALPELYYSPQGKEWFAVLKSKYRASLKLFSSTDLEFNKAFLKDGFAGSLTKGLVLLTEALLGPFLARYGQYPLFVITKT